MPMRIEILFFCLGLDPILLPPASPTTEKPRIRKRKQLENAKRIETNHLALSYDPILIMQKQMFSAQQL